MIPINWSEKIVGLDFLCPVVEAQTVFRGSLKKSSNQILQLLWSRILEGDFAGQDVFMHGVLFSVEVWRQFVEHFVKKYTEEVPILLFKLQKYQSIDRS